MSNQKTSFKEIREELTNGKKMLSELTFDEIYALIRYAVSIEYNRNITVSRIYSQEDIVQDIALEMLRDHNTENLKATKSNITEYVKQGMTVAHFSNIIFSAARQWISIICSRQQSTVHLLQNASLDAELDDEKSSLYNIIACKDEAGLNVEEILNRLPDIGNKKFFIRIAQKNGKEVKLRYTYKNLMKLYIYLYNRNEEHKIKNYIYEVETNKKVVDIDQVLKGFRLCLKEYDVLSAM